MAQHASSKKRIRQAEGLREDNRYYKKSARTAIKKLRETTVKSEAAEFLPKVISMIDRLVRRNSWHRNKAANLKSSLTKHVTSLS
jgi:small subunit ribosomal protein S20